MSIKFRELNKKNWEKLSKIGELGEIVAKRTKIKSRESVEAFVREVKENIEEGGVAGPGLSSLTVLMKGSSTPLIDKGIYYNSWKVIDNLRFPGLRGEFNVFGGIDNSVTTTSGSGNQIKQVMEIAPALEFEVKQEVTEKMRTFLRSHGSLIRDDTEFIINPARPHIGPAMKKFPQRIKAKFKRLLFDSKRKFLNQ